LSAPAAPLLAPAARHFCEPLKTLGLSTTDFRSRLRLPAGNDIGPATSDPRLPVAIHPGSGSPRKNWPRERWTEMMARLEEPVLLVLGDAEMEKWSAPSVARLCSTDDKRIKVATNLPLPELAAALTRCRLFLGHDSGVSHLAAAVGTPCVLLFGPTDPAMWAPPGDHVRALRRGTDLDTLGVEEVLSVLSAAS
jgi:heptosyltransferase-2